MSVRPDQTRKEWERLTKNQRGPGFPNFIGRMIEAGDALASSLSTLEAERDEIEGACANHIANAREDVIALQDVLATVRAECDLPDHIAELVGAALESAGSRPLTEDEAAREALKALVSDGHLRVEREAWHRYRAARAAASPDSETAG